MPITRRNGPTGLDPHQNTGPRTFDPAIMDRAGTGTIDPSLSGRVRPRPITGLPEVAAARLAAARDEAKDLGAALLNLADEQMELYLQRGRALERVGVLRRNRLADDQARAEAKWRVDQLKAQI